MRLEPQLPFLQHKLAEYFNSIKVRLERLSDMRLSQSLMEFQFHKGAIRTPLTFIVRESTPKFQFHKGAIRTPQRYEKYSVYAISIP